MSSIPCSNATATATNASFHTPNCSTSSVSVSDHRLLLYSRLDLLLLVLNVTVILLPLGKYFLVHVATRLAWVKCLTTKQWFNVGGGSLWKSASSSTTTTTTTTATTSATNSPSTSSASPTPTQYSSPLVVQSPRIQFVSQKPPVKLTKSVTLNDTLQSSRENDPLTGGGGGGEVRIVRAGNRRLRKPTVRQVITDRLGEIATQTLYIVLLVVYLAYTLELLIVFSSKPSSSTNHRTNTTSSSESQSNQHHHKHDSNNRFNIVSLELITACLTTGVHLVEYGVVYGTKLWLTSKVDVLHSGRRPLSSANTIAGQGAVHTFRYTLISFAFVYHSIQAMVNLAKLILIALLFQNRSELMFQLLKPYLLVVMLTIQGYFVLRHLLQLISINNTELRRGDSVSKLNHVKYRRTQSTFLSMITFTWFLDILRLGYHKNLELNDLGSLPRCEQTTWQYERFYKQYRLLNIHEHQSTFLWIVCWRTYKKSLIFGALIKILSDLSSLIGPVSIGYILNYISLAQANLSGTNGVEVAITTVVSDSLHFQFLTANEFFRNAYVVAIIVLIATLMQSTFSNNFNHLVISEGIHLKTALNCCIYNKALRMPVSNSEQHIDSGVISNYMSTDSSNIFQFFTMMHYLWAVPIKIAILLYLLYLQMGVSAVIGATIFFILSPFQYYCSRKISQIQKLQMDVSDQRLSKTTELFMGIKLLKLLGWDLSYAENIKRYRNTELEYLKKDAIFVAINTFITQGSAILVTMITFNLFPYIERRPLTSATVFTSIALFNQITTPLYIVPLVIPMLVSAIVSHRRLVDYLSIRELKTDFIRWDDGPLRMKDIVPNSAPILMPHQHRKLDRTQSALTHRPPPPSSIMNDLCCYTRNGKFAWYDELHNLEQMDSKVNLSEVNVHLPRAKLTIVVGSIGCGKSTFLASLLGETYLGVGGELHWLTENANGFGYVPSNPWILNVSLQENITFGRSFDRRRYEEVIKACCLQADVDLLPYGDQTVIGERGITLSGGQRQRIALARAIYSNTATLILDDALSALDPIVGYSVFDNAILRLAIRQQRRTVVLATHRHEFLSNADYVVVIESGAIKHQGPLHQIEKEDKAFFYQWNVIKEREIRERLKQKPRTCKTTEERHRLVRILSKKGEFRGPLKPVKREASINRFKRKPKPLSRQMSYDAGNALPCHEWVECMDDVIQESELEMDPSSLTTGRSANAAANLSRLISSESEHSKHSYLSLSSSNSVNFIDANQNSVTSTQSAITPSNRPPIMRLNSRISNYSMQANSIIEEEDDDTRPAVAADLCCKHNCNVTECGCPVVTEPRDSDAESSGVESDSEQKSNKSEDSPVEDNTQEVNNELLYEIISFNENQVETGTLYNVDINPQNNHISVNVYLAYMRAHSISLASLVFGLIILNQAVKVVSDFWLAKWTDSDEQMSASVNRNLSATESSQSVDTLSHENMQHYIYTYTALSLISVVISLSTNVSAQLIAIRAVRLMHDNLIDTLVRCPLRFFDKTPIGRIMNRFTNDINVIDKKLPIAIPVLLRFFFLCLSAIVVNIIITPYFLLAVIPILVVYYYLQKVFRTTSRQLQRLELTSKAPIISHFNQTVDGLTTIRAFHEQSMFMEKFFQLLDINNLCFLMVNSANCCLGVFLDYLGAVILFLATLISITAALYWNVQSAFVGLAMTYTLLVPVYLNWLVRNLASVEMNMQSVERIYRYTQLEIEDSCLNKLKSSDKSVPEEWPQSGEIHFQSVSIRYETNFEPIIKNANIQIRAGEKIGICGRTGSGKSSLISALFRINQICQGRILIDGQDITKICPYRLRKRLSIIPQDMVLFSGTVRQNLDPGERHTDEEIWSILKDFQLDRAITSLDEEIVDDQSISSGVRQLLCCARAFLRHSPVLIMDESTSMLDSKSERLVLDQIFRSQKTIIAIAHRIMNIANFDRVLVVNEGRVAEFDTPENLLRRPNSIFYSLYHKQNSR